MQNGRNKVVVAMSGGVDSSVAAALLKRRGFDVVGIFMKFWKDPSTGSGQVSENRCCSIESEKMARLVAKKIGIPFYVINAEKEFKKKVVDYFLGEYKNGTTPNPCVICNKEIKFGLLLEKALKLGADFVATGHYAINKEGRIFISKDSEKDQSYFLWQLNQKQLKHTLFPVGEYTKPEVRKLAKKFKLPTAEISESQEVCFVQTTTGDFLKKYLKPKPGNIIAAGKIVGKHNGLYFYTIGQRKGIGLGGSASAKGSGETKPFYVVDKDFKKNNLIVSNNKKGLFKKKLVAKNVNWIFGRPKLPAKVKARIRYRTKLADASIQANDGNSVNATFVHSQKAITPGQSVVFYKGRELFGGGIIK